MEQLLKQNNFTPAEIAEFMSNAQLIECERRTVLLSEGTISRYIYWARSGIFRTGYTDKNGNVHTRLFASPEGLPYLAAYTSFNSQTPSAIFLEAIEAGELWAWHYDYIENIQNNDHKWLKFFKRQLDAIAAMRDTKEIQEHTLTPDEQYAIFLKAYPDIANRIPQHYIASYIGISPESLSRIRKRYKEEK
jgi:CRP/FNR family transcriptional regulator, cyclic AMP receptor protein